MLINTNNPNIANAKALLRENKLKELKSFPKKQEESKALVEKLKNHKLYKESEVILLYVPLKSEVNITPLLNDERVLLPYINNGKMFFSNCKELEKSSLGFLEPKIKSEYKYEKALMIVPLLAFDNNNYRLGRGGGFYDRYISEHQDKLYTISLAYSISLTAEVPHESFDKKIDQIIYIK